jgi:hypothetical protein
MMERPNLDDYSDSQPDSAPGSDGKRKPRDPKSGKPKVTPLDEEKHIEDGIEIKET